MSGTFNIDQININITDVIPPENFATIDAGANVGTVYTKAQDNEWRAEVEQNVTSGIKGVAKPDDTVPATGFFRMLVDSANIYTNYKDASNAPIVVSAQDINIVNGVRKNEVTIEVNNGVSTKVIYAKVGSDGANGTANIPDYNPAISYVEKSRVFKNGSDWRVVDGQTANVGDVPGVSDKWVSLGGSSDPEKVVFNSVVKFDKKRKYSVINQSGDINITFDSSGTIKDSMVKHLVVSDGVGDINFSSDFEAFGDIDKTKNQEIFYSRPEIVEFKIPAIIMNVAKSGNVTPIDLDDDAEILYNKIVAAGATLTNTEINAMNNLFLAAKANGYFSKLKGLYLVLGNTTASRLLNGISGRPDAILSSGTVTNDGIVGVLDSQMKPSDIFSLNSFSYGIHNTSASYNNLRSMGCGVSSTSGITFLITGTSPSGQSLISGPNRDIFGQIANADSLGNYVVSRTASNTAKLYKAGLPILTHSVSQGSATLPNINFAIGGYNNNGVITDDGRTTKWAFLADGLTDAEVSSIINDMNMLMSAIGR